MAKATCSSLMRMKSAFIVYLWIGIAVFSTVAARAQTTWTVTVMTDNNSVGADNLPGLGPGYVDPSNSSSYDLRYALNQAIAAGGGQFIFFDSTCTVTSPCTIKLNNPLPPIESGTGSSLLRLDIDGGAFGSVLIDGQNHYRVFFADAGMIALKNLQIQNALAKGGDGGNGGGGGGGGGLGAGAGLFINANGMVSVYNTYFLNCQATGGKGGFGASSTEVGLTNLGVSGGGGGMAFDGGHGYGPDSALDSSNGGGGGMLSAGGNGILNASGAGGMGGGGGGGGAISTQITLGGSGYGSNSSGSPSTFAQTGLGVGGNGGFGGGGGGSTSNLTDQDGNSLCSNGGFGGGGGGGGLSANAGNGGPGGGGGGDANGLEPRGTSTGGIGGCLIRRTLCGGNGGGYASDTDPANTLVTGGGGGAAAGPAIFVNQGSLVIYNSGAHNSNATGGQGGTDSDDFTKADEGDEDSTPVFNVNGMVNGSSNPTGAIPGALPDGLPAMQFKVSLATMTVVAGVADVLTITAEDSDGNATAAYNGTIQLTLAPSSDSLGSMTGFTLGAHTANTFNFHTAGSGLGLTAVDTTFSSITGALGGITVVPGPVASLSLDVPPNAALGVPFNFEVTAKDSFGNAISNSSDTVTFSSSDGSAVLRGPTALGGGAFSATLNTAGSQTITVTDGSVSGTSSLISVSVGALTAVSGTPQSAYVSAGFATPLVIRSTVNGGSPVAGATVTFTVVPGSNGAGAVFSNGFGAISVVTDSNGYANAPTLTANAIAGGFTVIATTGGLSTSFALTVVVYQAAQTISFNPPASVTYGVSPFALTASASSGLPVTFSYISGPATLNATTNVLTITGAGSVVVAANQAGNGNYLAAPEIKQTIVVAQTSQTITAFNPPASVTYGVTPIALSASATSSLPVSFSLVSGPATLNATTNLLTITGTGSVVIAANQAGNGNYLAAPEVKQSIVVTQASQTITAFNPPPSVTYGVTPIALSASATSSLPVSFNLVSGPATLNATTNLLTITGTGSVVIAANQAGNGNYLAAPEVKQTIVVTQASQTITAFNPPASVTYGVTPITLSASSTSGDPVTFRYVSGPATLNVNVLTITGTGSVVVAGNVLEGPLSNYLSAKEVQQTITVDPPSLLISADSKRRIYGTANPAFTGSVNGNVNGDTFTESFATTAVIDSNVGTYAIVPSVAGANLADYTQSVTNGVLTVQQASSTTTLTASSTSITPVQSLNLTAVEVSVTTGTPTGAINFYDGGTFLGSAPLVAGVAKYDVQSLAPGVTHALTASYVGDINFTASSSPATGTTVAVAPLDFTVNLSGPGTKTLAYGGTVSYQFVVNPMYGSYAGPVSFSAAGLPPGASAGFSPTTIAANSGSQTVTLTIVTAKLTALRQSPFRGDRLSPALLSLLLSPIGFVVAGRKIFRRWLGMLLMLACAAATIAATGCGSGSAQPEKDYTVTITATSGGVQHSTTVLMKLQ